jgi:hypothetical protein
MKKRVFTGLAIAVFSTLGIISVAQGTLLGDTVHIAQNYSTIGSEHYPVDVVVTNGIEHDIWSYYNVDVGADFITVDFKANVTFLDVPDSTPPYFNGPIVIGLDDSSGNDLVGFSLTSNHSGFTSSDVYFGSNWLGFNLEGLSFNSSHYLTAQLDFQANPVPEPTTMLLFGAGLAGIAGLSRRKK